ncbi:MAG TPA: hypothetical protein VFI41_12695 [Gemmatimonadales bacterium]|nr:hypothetical protein [Gemmatimonadales bacterium]
MTSPFAPFIPSADPAGPRPLTADEILSLQANTPTASAIRQMPAVAPGMLARLFGGADPLQQGLLTPDQANSLGRQSLLDTGLAILAASGPHAVRPGIGEILAQGLQAGRQGYQQRFGQEQAVAGAVSQQHAAQAMAALRQKYAGKSDIPSLTAYMHDLIGLGTPEALAGARALSEYLKSQSESAVRGIPIATVGPDGKPITQLVDPTTSRPIGSPMARIEPPDPQLAINARLTQGDIANFNRQFAGTLNSKMVDAYWRASSHLQEARNGTPGSYKAAITQFIQSAEPGSQIRLGMLQYLQDIDPSVHGRADIALRKLTDGTWDPKYLDGLQRIMDSNFKETMDRYTAAYNDLVSQNPDVRPHISAPDIFFGTRAMGRTPGVSGGAAGSARDRLRQAAGGRP